MCDDRKYYSKLHTGFFSPLWKQHCCFSLWCARIQLWQCPCQSKQPRPFSSFTRLLWKCLKQHSCCNKKNKTTNQPPENTPKPPSFNWLQQTMNESKQGTTTLTNWNVKLRKKTKGEGACVQIHVGTRRQTGWSSAHSWEYFHPPDLL